MNKRFFTLMAAVMLAGSPFASEAFAQTPTLLTEQTEEEDAVSVDFLPYGTSEIEEGETFTLNGPKLANNVKFILEDANGKYVTVVSKKAKNGTFLSEATATSDIKKAAVFEVRNYVSNALGVTFSLYVDGKQFAVNNGETADADLTFTATKTGDTYALENLTSINIAKVVGGAPVFTFGDEAYTIGTLATEYDDAAFTEYNKNNVTLSFDASGLEGNVFSNMKAVTLETAGDGGKFVVGTYLVQGKAADIEDFKDTPSKTTAAKLTFVYLKNEQYKIDALVKGEGYKFTTINGAQFYAEKNPAVSNNAAFQDITELDQLNNEGSLVITISPIVGSGSGTLFEDLIVAAVKTSATDTKSYVTTLNPDEEEGSRLTPIYPTLGANAYFAASEFLKKGAVSAYNIYFPTAKAASTDKNATEYHKYMVTSLNDQLKALAANEIDLSTPYAQWIVSDFDNRYTVTLTNRMTGKELVLRLDATDKAGVYDVVKEANNTTVYVGEVTVDGFNSNVDLSETTIQLIPVSVSKNDANVQLAKADREEGLKMAFSGKSAQLGEVTYYAELNENGRLIPNVNASKASPLNFEVYEPATAEAANFVKVTPYAYLNAAGLMETEKDSLVYTTYTISRTYKVAGENVTDYMNESLVYERQTSAAGANKFIILKAENGKSLLATRYAYRDNVYNEAFCVGSSYFYSTSGISYLSDDDFCYVSFTVNDNSDKTTLPAVSRHITFENALGSVSFQENKNGILEGILAAEPMTFWLDSADTDAKTPSFYISKGIATEETPETKADEVAMRNFLFYATDSLNIFDEGSAIQSINKKYVLEGTEKDLKAIFRPAALIAEDTLASVVAGKEVTVVTKDADAKKGQVNGLKSFQYGICLADEAVADEYVIYSKADNSQYLYSLNGKLGFTGDAKKALVVTLGAGDPTANEAIEAESGIEVIGGQGVVTVQGAAGKVITVANILGQTIANQVAASDNVTIAAPAGIVVVSVDGDATKVIVK